jgi:CelD/BcsL family acetyltransferase involved in cellulose biosynthesis
LDIVVSSDITKQEWDRMVIEDGRASFFNTRDWSDLLVSTLPTYRHAHLVCRVGGKAVACLPAVIRSRLGALSLESMAYGTFGGPVLGADAPPGAAGALLAAFARRARGPRVVLAQVVDRHGRVSGADLPGFEKIDFTIQEVALDAPYDELFARFRPSARNKIRKAVKAGVEVRRASGEEDFLAYYTVLEQCSRDWNVRPRPGRSFFAALSLLDPSKVQMWLATSAGEVIAGDLNFVTNGVVMNWGNVSTDAAKDVAPSNLLHANAIEQGVLEGCHTYDLGGSAGLEGVVAFKASFGAVEKRISRYFMERPWRRAARAALERVHRSEAG